MDNTLLVALIAGVVSLLVSIISLVGLLISHKNTKTTQFELSELKYKLDAEAEQRIIKQEEEATKKNIRRNAIAVIQRSKDTLLLVLNSVETSLSMKEAMTLCKKCRDDCIGSFSSSKSLLTSDQEDWFHKSKNLTIQMCEILETEIPDKKYASAIDDKTKSALLHIREELSNYQRLIQDS